MDEVIPSINYPRLSVLTLRLGFLPESVHQLPEHTGSAWRGALGHGLKEACCTNVTSSCDTCKSAHNCAYLYLFETPVPDGARNRGINTKAPHPFVIRIKEQSGNATHTHIELTLIGHGLNYLGEAVEGLQRAGLRGIAKPGNRFRLDTLEYLTGSGWQPFSTMPTDSGGLSNWITLVPPPPQQPITITLSSPLRLKSGNGFASACELSPEMLFRSLLTRLYSLAEIHGDELTLYPTALHSKLKALSFSNNQLYWQELDRYSSRQERKHKIGGLLGSVEIDLSEAPELWPPLWLGQFIHIGKLVTMGHGTYTLTSQACQPHISRNDLPILRLNRNRGSRAK